MPAPIPGSPAMSLAKRPGPAAMGPPPAAAPPPVSNPFGVAVKPAVGLPPAATRPPARAVNPARMLQRSLGQQAGQSRQVQQAAYRDQLRGAPAPPRRLQAPPTPQGFGAAAAAPPPVGSPMGAPQMNPEMLNGILGAAALGKQGADFGAAMAGAGNNLLGHLQTAWQGLSPQARTALQGAGIGAGVGAVGHMLGGKDEEEGPGLMGHMALGAGVGGAAGYFGHNMMLPKATKGMPTPDDNLPNSAGAFPDHSNIAATGGGALKFGVAMAKRAGEIAVNEQGKAGPFDAGVVAGVSGLDKRIAGMERNRHENPGHYWLNPFVPGPLSELMSRYQRRALASTATGYGPLIGGAVADQVGGNLMAAAGAPGVPLPLGSGFNAATGGAQRKQDARAVHARTSGKYNEGVQKEAAGGPFDTSMGANVSQMDEQISSMERNRHEHPGHYWLNPFVPGPLTEMLARYSRRASAGMHDSWGGALSALPTLGIAPAIMGGDAAKQRARQDYQTNAAPYEQAELDEDKAEVAAAPRKPGMIDKAVASVSPRAESWRPPGAAGAKKFASALALA